MGKRSRREARKEGSIYCLPYMNLIPESRKIKERRHSVSHIRVADAHFIAHLRCHRALYQRRGGEAVYVHILAYLLSKQKRGLIG